MKKGERSRQQWEQELWERQLNLTDDQTLRALQHVARTGSSDTFTPTQLLSGIAGCVLLVLGIGALFSAIPHSILVGCVAIVVGVFLVWMTARSDGRRRSR